MFYLTSHERRTIVFVLSLLILGLGLDFYKKKTNRADLVDYQALEEKLFDKVNINQAGALEFSTIPGVGQSLAYSIVEERRLHGKFKYIADLKRVRGIKDRKLQQLRRYIIIETAQDQ